MDRRRGAFERQKSSTGTPTTPSSPVMMSPLNRHARAGSTGSAMTNVRRAQNTATKAAAQRLAQVMSHQTGVDDDDDDDDIALDYSTISGAGSIGLGGGRPMPTRSPMAVRNVQEQPPSARSRSPMSVRSAQEQPLSARSRSPMSVRSAQEQPPSARSRSPAAVRTAVEQPQSVRAISSVRSTVSAYAVEQPPPRTATPVEQQPPSARSTTANRTLDMSPSTRTILVTRSSQPSNASNDQPPSARSTSGRPSGLSKVVPMVPPSVPITLRPAFSGGIPPSESPFDIRKDRRLSLDLGSMKVREAANQPQRPTSELEDELDMVQEENDNLVEKLRLAEEKCEEAESRVRQLEQQVANLGEGVTLEARLLSRQEAALQRREAALRSASKNHGGFQAVAAGDAEAALEETTSALEKLRLMTQRMILTSEEMEEVVLKRCWLAQYWGLCVKHGILAEIAEARYKYWSKYAPNPIAVVLAAGEKAKGETDLDLEDTEDQRDLNELSGEGNIENMLFVEQGLRELASLKVEEALAVALAQHRRPNMLKADDLKLPIEGQCDAFELSQEEAEDVSFKQAWLTYIWRRAKRHEIEPDIADERLQYWINHNSRTPNSQDAVDVERGLAEIKKLGIETQLWDESRKELEQDIDNAKKPTFLLRDNYFQAQLLLKEGGLRLQSARIQTFTNWKFPLEGWIKINTDGSCARGGLQSGCGRDIRDYRGDWLAGFSKNLGHNSSVATEIWGSYLGLQIA
ncbi:coiled-coil domain-containing protein SCD2-like [Gastrolobium bilobum]|uniref:coiled-coil domain-containing protein SCD2-like n=1 Tax=Gastrolobium bilobum TaxID=150636 RepID=UPI002AB3207D|nr:coiled-coil domain-containing protein SCD2-like [Gastrolobium bilobum]